MLVFLNILYNITEISISTSLLQAASVRVQGSGRPSNIFEAISLLGKFISSLYLITVIPFTFTEQYIYFKTS